MWIFFTLTASCEGLREKARLTLQLSPDSLDIEFLKESPKSFTLSKVKFTAMKMWQIATFDIFQKVLFLTFCPSIDLGLTAIVLQYGTVYRNILFFFQNKNKFRFLYIRKKKERPQKSIKKNLSQNTLILFHLLA